MAGQSARSAVADGFQRPSALANAFDTTVLRGQYVLTRTTPSTVPEGWLTETLDGWTLVTEPQLPVLVLEGRSGGRLGWVLGYPVDLEAGAIVSGVMRLECDIDGHGAEIAVDEELHRLGGRWVAICLGPRPLLYPDGSASLPAFVAPQAEAVTSSPFMLREQGEHPDDSPLVDVLRVYQTGLTFALCSTPFAGIDLVPPHHVLDLSSWAIRRCWPSGALEPLDLPEAVERVAATFEATVAAAVSIGPAHVGLTAGGDTRLIVACSRNVLDEIDFFTVPFRDASGSTDAHWAPKVAARFGLRHRVLPWIAPSDDDLRLWMFRTSCVTGEKRGRLAAPTYAQLGGSGVYVSGVNGSAARGDYWKAQDRYDTSLPARDLLRMIGLPEHPEHYRRLAAWQEQLPQLDHTAMLTLLQFEMCDGAWSGALACSYPDAAPATLYPYCSRAVVDIMTRAHWADRREDRIRLGVIESRWPELLELPLNRMSAQWVVRRRARRYAGYAQAAARKARRALGGRRRSA